MQAQAPEPMPNQTVMRFYNQPHRFYCGVDLHARTMYLYYYSPISLAQAKNFKPRWQ